MNKELIARNRFPSISLDGACFKLGWLAGREPDIVVTVTHEDEHTRSVLEFRIGHDGLAIDNSACSDSHVQTILLLFGESWQPPLSTAWFESFETDLRAQFGNRLRLEHYRALAAMQQCRTQASPKMQVQCSACPQTMLIPHSCG